MSAIKESLLPPPAVGGVPVSLERLAYVPLIPSVPGTNGQSHVLTLKQTAQYLRISKAHLSNVIHGKVADVPPLRHAQIGGRTLIKREWADEWLEKAGRSSPFNNGII